MAEHDPRREPGWKRDPWQRYAGRYWDGQRWTEHVLTADRAPATDPVPDAPVSDVPPVPPVTPPATKGIASAESQAAPGVSRPRRVWRIFRQQPAWLQGLVALVAFLAVVGSASGGSDKEPVVSSANSSTTKATLSHVQVTTPPTIPPPTPPPTVATTTTLPSRESQLAAFIQAFERTRVGLAEAIKKDNPVAVSSVDRFEFDPAGPTVILSVSSEFRTAQYLQDSAWAVTKSLQPLWEAKTIASMPDIVPRFRLTVGTVRYNCPSEFMVRLAQLRASREDWETTCRA